MLYFDIYNGFQPLFVSNVPCPNHMVRCTIAPRGYSIIQIEKLMEVRDSRCQIIQVT